MADNQSAFKVTESWARAAKVTSSHERDYFVEAIRDMQRQRGSQPGESNPAGADSAKQSD
jgi:hypothetical protein